jgi:hypothetical protein
LVVALLGGRPAAGVYHDHVGEENAVQAWVSPPAGRRQDVLDDLFAPIEATGSRRREVLQALRGNHAKRPGIHGRRVARSLAAMV